MDDRDNRHGLTQWHSTTIIGVKRGDTTVIADIALIQRVLENLIDNAIKYTPDGGEVSVSLRSRGDNCFIDVADNGAGIDQAHLPHIFERHYAVAGESVPAGESTGLGLAIVGSILAENEALIEVDSEVNRGTTFTVWWPVSTSVTTSKRPKSQGQQRSDLPILVLDDAPEVAEAIGRELSSAGYEVAETNFPEDALETIVEDPEGWACLVTDYDMPGMTGGDLIARLEEKAPELPVIVVSALARRLTDKRLDRAVAVLQKPVNKDKLLEAVRTVTTTAQ